MAWLNSPLDPKDHKSRTRLAFRTDPKNPKPLNLPSVEAEHLLPVLDSLGWCMAAGMGVGPISAAELMAWSQGMQHPLDPWEFEAVRSASRAYCAQLASEDPREPNFLPETEDKPISAIRAMAAALNKPKDAK